MTTSLQNVVQPLRVLSLGAGVQSSDECSCGFAEHCIAVDQAAQAALAELDAQAARFDRLLAAIHKERELAVVISPDTPRHELLNWGRAIEELGAAIKAAEEVEA